jgi:hypothetical protein
MNRILLLIVVSLLLPTVVFAQDPPKAPDQGQEAKAQKIDITGVWDTVLEFEWGARNITTTFKQDGERLTGSIGFRGEDPLDGTITGADLKFAVTSNAGGQTMSIAFTGKVEGDTIAGVFSLGEIGTAKWSAKRQKM